MRPGNWKKDFSPLVSHHSHNLQKGFHASVGGPYASNLTWGLDSLSADPTPGYQPWYLVLTDDEIIASIIDDQDPCNDEEDLSDNDRAGKGSSNE
ncbi:hypothetical protein AVEN_111873-1 [Araneus ventricosus]|uniref:Uncharacterized protein n=1 Tax=Araneus ventricosus TaxID=182803 RepID=A0A4Y2C051_ARAVE|nr:hypothetical protein AVEN_111873-1 [Araneus ventricosus]